MLVRTLSELQHWDDRVRWQRQWKQVLGCALWRIAHQQQAACPMFSRANHFCLNRIGKCTERDLAIQVHALIIPVLDPNQLTEGNSPAAGLAQQGREILVPPKGLQDSALLIHDLEMWCREQRCQGDRKALQETGLANGSSWHRIADGYQAILGELFRDVTGGHLCTWRTRPSAGQLRTGEISHMPVCHLRIKRLGDLDPFGQSMTSPH